MAMYEQYPIEEAASIVSDATVIADRYDAVMADTDFRESRSVDIFVDLQPKNIPSIYDEDVATFFRSSLLLDHKEGGEEDSEFEGEAPDDAVTTSGSSSSTHNPHVHQVARNSADTRGVENSQRKFMRWRTVLGRHKSFHASRPPPHTLQGSLLLLCTSGWQPPPRPEQMTDAKPLPIRDDDDEERQSDLVPIPSISWGPNGRDDDSSVSFNINFSLLSNVSVESGVDCSGGKHNDSSIGSAISESTAMVLDQFIELNGNGDCEDREGLDFLGRGYLFAFSFDASVEESLSSTIDREEDGGSMSDCYSTTGNTSSAASGTLGGSPNESFAESRDSYDMNSDMGNSGESSTVGTLSTDTIASSAKTQQLGDNEEDTQSKAGANGEESTISDVESVSSTSSDNASAISEMIHPGQSFLETLTCGAVGSREANDLVEEDTDEDSRSTSSSSPSEHSLRGNIHLDARVEYPNANFDDSSTTFSSGKDQGVEVEIESLLRSDPGDSNSVLHYPNNPIPLVATVKGRLSRLTQEARKARAIMQKQKINRENNL